MRQTDLDKVHQNSAGRSSGRPVSFPDALLYRGRAADGADCLATFDRRSIVIARQVGALPCRVRVPICQYDAVAVVSSEERHRIRLMHDDPGLTLDLVEMDDLGDAEEYCDRLARFLDLPSVLVAGSAAEAEPADVAEAANAAPAMRRDPALRRRRPRFLARRKSGEVIFLNKVAGREIMARS
jgi:hypothetical protein